MIHIEKLIPGGEALGTLDQPLMADGSPNPDHGKKVLLWNALPGEDVAEFELTKRKSSYLEGIATVITHPSPHRVAPKDTLYLSTSPWQIMDWDYELAQKRALVAESLRQAHVPLDGIEISPTQTDGKQWHYRNKMEYALYWDNTDEQIYLAFRARGSHRKLPLKPSTPLHTGAHTALAAAPRKDAPTSSQEALRATEAARPLMSSIERPELLEAALQCVQGLNNRHDEARKYQSLLLRCDQNGKVSGGLFENHRPHPAFPHLTDFILGHEYSYSPNGFFQINLPVYELALKEIQKHITTSQVLDLYAGVGTIGLSVARDRHLTLVECDASAYRELVSNYQSAGAKSDSISSDSASCDCQSAGAKSDSISSNSAGSSDHSVNVQSAGAKADSISSNSASCDNQSAGAKSDSISSDSAGSSSQNYQHSRVSASSLRSSANATECCDSDDCEPRTSEKYGLDLASPSRPHDSSAIASPSGPHLSRSEEALAYIQPEQTVILDPPRAGCDARLIARLCEVQPTTIIYLSCNPTTQARDVAMLLPHYRIESITPFNFFPKTPHIENLIVLTRR